MKPDRPIKLDRRAFLKLTGMAGGGLILGVTVGCSGEDPPDPQHSPPASGPAQAFQPNAFVQISQDGIVIYAPNPEVGQGVKTSLPMIVAEELDANWDEVTVVQAPIDPAFGAQFAGGSRSTPMGWLPLRQAGATARHMLVTAAATRWEVDRSEVETRDSMVIHTPTGRRLSYLELASAAAQLPVPDPSEVELQDPSEFTLLGRRITGVDNEPLVTGGELFGIDKRLPNLAYATFVKCPAFGGTVKSANVDAVKRQPGVIDAFVIEGNNEPGELASGVAIVAEDTWCAFKAREALEVTWDETNAAKDSWSATERQARELARQAGKTTVVDNGNVDDAFGKAAKTLEAFYQYAFISHAQLEPQNTTAWWHDGTMELWAPSQTPQRAQQTVAEVLDLAADKVTVHQMRGGGGFGRRLINDPVVEAAAIARRMNRPVKLTWKREDDMAHDFYRAGGFHALKGALDANGKLIAWDNHFISFTNDGTEAVSGGAIRPGTDPEPFVPNYRVTTTLLRWGNPCGPWRAPGSNVFAFVHQCFLHELSTAAGRDHVEFLLELLGEPRWLKEGDPNALHTGRAAGVIRRAAEEAGWGTDLPEGHGLGIAFYFSHAGHIAEAAEVSVTDDKRLVVHRVTVAADVGPIINLSGAENQVMGSVQDGLSAMLGQRITFENGRAQELNFHQYPMMRIPRAPRVDVHFIDSDFPPTGLGEPALPPLAPAVGNAIFAATGERVRRLPIVEAGLS
ncbi:MAG TPA: molybdopterin cofactor-binding domain-containing protein [Pseudomonadales bacterium]